MTFSKNLITLCLVGLITYVGNYISYLAMMKHNSPPFDPIGAFLGMVVIIALALVGWLLSKHVKIKLESPTVIWISVLAPTGSISSSQSRRSRKPPPKNWFQN